YPQAEVARCVQSLCNTTPQPRSRTCLPGRLRRIREAHGAFGTHDAQSQVKIAANVRTIAFVT
ncbi:MAG: hypothetical protein ABL908_19440, partial [Hyphomicrobium sp.]